MNLLAALHPDHYTELRMIRNGAIKQEFFIAPTDHDLLTDSAALHDAEGWDCYIGVLPRIRASGKAEDTTPTTSVLWADLDNKHLEGGHMASFLALHRAGLEPSILVDSGNGLHAYWLLREPVAFRIASAAMQGLHKVIGSDHVHDAPRVLRLPGTRNHKACEFGHAELESGEAISHCNGKPVRLLKLEPSLRYRWQDFSDFIPEPEPLAKRADSYDMGRQEYHDLPHWLKKKIEEGAPEGQRSEAIFDVVLNLLKRGWEEDEIESLFQVMPIGEKTQEMGERQATRYITRTVTKAREIME
jgi:hypothetical protein